MRQQGITDVLDLRGEPLQGETGPHPEPYVGTGIRYHYVPMLDRGGDQPAEVYQHGVGIMQTVLADPRRKILVHCAAGVSRSPSMVYAYLRTAGLSPPDAWALIEAHRSVADRQYVASAERAMPFLSSAPGSAGKVVLLAVVASAAYFWRSRRRR